MGVTDSEGVDCAGCRVLNPVSSACNGDAKLNFPRSRYGEGPLRDLRFSFCVGFLSV